MEHRNFGINGPEVTVFGFGAGHIGNPEQDEKEVELLLNEILDLGINFIDTARAYGLSEQRIGKYIAHRRSEYILSTKVGYDVSWTPDWTYNSVVGGIDQALALLKTDYLDIVHLHSCSKDILQQGDVIAALEKAKEAGKVRMIAYSGENDALEYALSLDRFDSIQTSVNLCDQRGIGKYLPVALSKGLGVIAKRPIANAPWRYSDPPKGHYSEEYWHRFRIMGFKPEDFDWNEIALRFSAYTPGVSTCITGSANIHHIKANLEAIAKGPLPDEILALLKTAFITKDDNWMGLI
jgi:aryl-alcohol dehydrogenase-like predicted oxidoreductase